MALETHRGKNLQIGLLRCDKEVVDNVAEFKQAHREYMECHILTAQPLAIVEMLYGIAIGALEDALRHLKDGNALARANDVSRAQEAVNELMVALDPSVDASLAGNLASLYVYAQEQILKGHVLQSEEAFRAALVVLKPLWEGWTQIREQENNSKPQEQTGLDVAEEEPVLSLSACSTSERGAAYQPELDPVSRDWNC